LKEALAALPSTDRPGQYAAKASGPELAELQSLTREVATFEASWKELSDSDVAAFKKMAK
jgi:hypothetical protein